MSLRWHAFLVEAWRQETMSTQADVERLGAQLRTRNRLTEWIRQRYPDAALREILAAAVGPADETEASLWRAGVSAQGSGRDDNDDDDDDDTQLSEEDDALHSTMVVMEAQPPDRLVEDTDASLLIEDPWELMLGPTGTTETTETSEVPDPGRGRRHVAAPARPALARPEPPSSGTESAPRALDPVPSGIS